MKGESYFQFISISFWWRRLAHYHPNSIYTVSNTPFGVVWFHPQWEIQERLLALLLASFSKASWVYDSWSMAKRYFHKLGHEGALPKGIIWILDATDLGLNPTDWQDGVYNDIIRGLMYWQNPKFKPFKTILGNLANMQPKGSPTKIYLISGSKEVPWFHHQFPPQFGLPLSSAIFRRIIQFTSLDQIAILAETESSEEMASERDRLGRINPQFTRKRRDDAALSDSALTVASAVDRLDKGGLGQLGFKKKCIHSSTWHYCPHDSSWVFYWQMAVMIGLGIIGDLRFSVLAKFGPVAQQWS